VKVNLKIRAFLIIIDFLTEDISKKCDAAEKEFYRISNEPQKNEEKLLALANNTYNRGDFRLFIKIFDKCSSCFFNLGINQFHDSLLDLLLAVVLIDCNYGSQIFQKLKYDSLWEMNTYDL